jgi:hypothetical protein
MNDLLSFHITLAFAKRPSAAGRLNLRLHALDGSFFRPGGAPG